MSHAPHICIVTTVHDPLDTRVFYREARTLAAAGYRVTLLAQDARDETIDGVRFRPLPPRRFSLPARARGLWIAWRAARREAADAYHLHDPELTLIGLLLKLEGRRVVLDVHEHTPFHILEKPYIPRPLRRPLAAIYDGWERLAARLADRVITVGEVIAARFGGRAVIVRNLPDLERFEACPANPATPGPDGSLTAIYTGVVERQRGLLGAARAVASLPPELNLRLRIVGPCPFPAFAAELIAAGQGRVRVEPPVPYPAIPALLAEAHIGLEVALPTRLNALLWPRKVFEYMAAGLPVIRADYPAWDAFAAEGCLAVDPADEGAIRAALLTLARDPDLRARLGSQGRVLVQNRFRWDNEARTLVELYAGLIGAPKGNVEF